MEQKYQIGNDYGSIVWDIEKIIRDKHLFKTRVYNVKELAADNPFHGSLEHSMQTDTTQPLIVVQLNESTDKLIDGNHRLQKALITGLKTITAYYLFFEEHRKYIVDYNKKMYHLVVNHWHT